jgi:cell division protein FtsZ
MTIRLALPKVTELKPRLAVIGVGGAGGNAVNNMISSGLSGVEFIVANTDAQALAASSAENRIQLGVNLTEGLGAGSKPEIGCAAAEEAIDEIRAQISGAHMVFIAAGMGGGTGTGAASVIARVARELNVLVVGIVTKPFQFEGARRMRMAEAGIADLKRYVDTMIVIPNQNLFRVATERTTFADAFVLADQVLYSGIACMVDLIVKEGLINLDFADVRTVLAGMGSAVMGTGEASGDRRAVIAAEEAISNPLLDDISLKGARGLLLSISGGRNLTLYEVDEAASRVRLEVDPEANIIVGATFDDSLDDGHGPSIRRGHRRWPACSADGATHRPPNAAADGRAVVARGSADATGGAPCAVFATHDVEPAGRSCADGSTRFAAGRWPQAGRCRPGGAQRLARLCDGDGDERCFPSTVPTRGRRLCPRDDPRLRPTRLPRPILDGQTRTASERFAAGRPRPALAVGRRRDDRRGIAGAGPSTLTASCPS